MKLLLFKITLLSTFLLVVPSVQAEKTNSLTQAKYIEGLSIVVKELLEQLHTKANSTNSPDKRNIKGFVLSTEVRSFRDIPINVDQEIQSLREDIRALIYKVATDIELGGNTGEIFVTPNGFVNYEDLPKDAVDEYKRLMHAKQINNISVQSVSVAIQMLSNLNQQLMQEAERAINIQQKRRLYITQSAFVYEMSDIVLELLDKVSLEGKVELERISQEHQQQINERMQSIDTAIKRVKQAASQGAISAEMAKVREDSYTLIKQANQKTLETWQEIMNNISKQNNALQTIKSKRIAIEIVRDNAKIQLDTLRDIAVVGEFHSLIGNIDKLVATVKDLELLELTPEVVSILLFGNPVYERMERK